MTGKYDAIIVGGGHNGLVAAAYLGRAGLKPLVLEAREDLGGAASTTTPFGPDYKITTLSYVMSLMPERIIRDLRLREHGYEVIPMGPSYFPFPDGRSLLLTGDRAHDHEQLSRFSSKDADSYFDYLAWIEGVTKVMAPLLIQPAPQVGSKRPRDLVDQLQLAWQMRGLDVRGVGDVTRLMTVSVADLLDDWFDSPEIKGALSVNGIIGTWAGPAAPGTAYSLMHESIGDVGEGAINTGQGSWGYPIGGMGAVSAAIAASARSLGATIRTETWVDQILVSGGKATGVVLADGTQLTSDLVIAATHPKITFLDQVDRRELPADFVADIERWKTRSGTVKINLAIDRLPTFTADPDLTPATLSGAVEYGQTIDEIEWAFQEARMGKASTAPFADTQFASTLDPTLAPEGHHVVSMFTQWVPHTWVDEPHTAELDAYADRIIAQYDSVAPGFADSILHRQVLGPHEMAKDYHLVGNIFHGELTPEQMFHMRPAPGYSDHTTPVEGLYQCSSATHGGGGVTGIAGYLATQRILSDRRRWSRRRSA